MCPEMNSKPSSSNMSALARVISLLMVSVFALCGCSIFNSGSLQRIPELEYVEEIDEGYYTTYCCVYDGKNFSGISKRPYDREEAEEMADMVYEFCAIKGRKVTDWSTDKITYPVYALTIEPRIFDDGKDVCETVVWTNGYLITSSGDVYLADPDFKPFLKANERDYSFDTELEGVAYTKSFRHLQSAGQQWHTDIMTPSYVTGDKIADGIEVKVTEQYYRDEFPFISVEITNNSDKGWNYCDNSIFVYLEVVVDDDCYCFYHDPDVHDDYLTSPSYSAVVEPGETVTKEFGIGLYGTKLPKGDYRLLISGVENNEIKYACAVFTLE